LGIRYRHHRQPRDPDQIEILEPGVGLDFLERHRPRQLPHRADVDDVRLAGLVGRIRIGVAERLRDPHHGFLVAGVIVEDLIALLDGSEIPLRDRILDAAPDGLLVFHELVVAVVRRFFFEQPVHTIYR